MKKYVQNNWFCVFFFNSISLNGNNMSEMVLEMIREHLFLIFPACFEGFITADNQAFSSVFWPCLALLCSQCWGGKSRKKKTKPWKHHWRQRRALLTFFVLFHFRQTLKRMQAAQLHLHGIRLTFFIICFHSLGVSLAMYVYLHIQPFNLFPSEQLSLMCSYCLLWNCLVNVVALHQWHKNQWHESWFLYAYAGIRPVWWGTDEAEGTREASEKSAPKTRPPFTQTTIVEPSRPWDK